MEAFRMEGWDGPFRPPYFPVMPSSNFVRALRERMRPSRPTRRHTAIERLLYYMLVLVTVIKGAIKTLLLLMLKARQK